MIIVLGADHKGFKLKEKIKVFLQTEGYSVIDKGAVSEEPVDYTDYAREVALTISQGHAQVGVLLCWTGIGMSIAANKFKGIRAFVASDTFSARLAKEHNDTNIICFGGGIIGEDLALDVLRTWLSSTFSGGRHLRRLNRIFDFEEGHYE